MHICLVHMPLVTILCTCVSTSAVVRGCKPYLLRLRRGMCGDDLVWPWVCTVHLCSKTEQSLELQGLQAVGLDDGRR